ncbi:alkaline phosphatase PafA [Namhaeicola litoreus]|uniref:Alkaline phosphatase PafA n=1 Tax=Namhaeicola litoreus TaxID=1052145 RepID=A0ABW3Y1F7_9FLAO
MKNVIIGLLLFCATMSFGQVSLVDQRPKLVVGIVVDQMRYDYLTRYYDKFGDDGFKRLMNDGFNCENAHFNYIPTYTAVGHSAIYTGSTPSVNGIIGNNWYDKSAKKSIYCVDDENYTTVGGDSGGNKSPVRLLTTTVTDELQLTQMKGGKVISISLKDRSAILPGGHMANAAYWFENKFITSTYYMSELPKWVESFNKKDFAQKYLKGKWETLYPIKQYTESIADDNEFEQPYNGQEKPVFPYDLRSLQEANGGNNMIKATPFGNSILIDFAKAAIESEKLGKNNVTDFLAISFSSPDYIGHQFGVDSKEVEDTYIRLDKELGDFLRFLDKQIGDNYTLFLTADHAAVQVPAYLSSLKIPSGYINSAEFKKEVEDFCKTRFGSDHLIEDFSNFQIFLNKEELKRLKLDQNEVSQILADFVIEFNWVLRVVDAKNLQNNLYQDRLMQFLKNGCNQKLSGDVMLIPKPATISHARKGTTHGSGFTYDTHVPILFYGKGIKKGKSRRFIPIVDIAPTISNLLKISYPNGNEGDVIEEALK